MQKMHIAFFIKLIFKNIFNMTINYRIIICYNNCIRILGLVTMGTVSVNSKLIDLAIKRSGLDYTEFIAKKPYIKDWISGKKNPTIKQLETFSRQVFLPFGYFFLNHIPELNSPIPLFRTVKDADSSVNLKVYDTIILLQQRQAWLKDYLIESGHDKLPFVGKFARYSDSDVAMVVADIKKELNLEDGWADKCKTWEDAFDTFSKKIEKSRISVVFNGVVENNSHRVIEVNDCRGFVLVDLIAPFMFINNSDSKSAQMFTIAHELAHIWIGKSAGFDFRMLKPAAYDRNEVFCDKVAAELLVPEKILKSIWVDNDYSKYAKYFKVSEIVVARRALDLGKITQKEFYNFYETYLKKDHRTSTKAGGDYYRTAKKRLSMNFLKYIFEALQTDKLLYRDAYRLTSMHGDTFHKLKKHVMTSWTLEMQMHTF